MTPSEGAQRYALALPGIWLTQNNGSFAHLGGRYASPSHRDWAQNVLSESWGIDGKPALLDRMKWLAEKGHSSEYLEFKARWQAQPELRESDLRLIHVGVFQQEIGDKGLVAWDQARCINVAGWGFLAGYITEEEAWDHIIPAAQKIQRAYGSWAEYGRGYMVGAAFWSAPAADKASQATAAMLADPASPWNTIPWKSPIGAGSSPSAATGESSGGMGWMMYAVGCGLLVLLGGGLLTGGVVAVGVIALMMMQGGASAPDVGGSDPSSPTASAAVSGDWDGSAPFVCGGNDNKTISGVTAKLDKGPAVLAKGNCVLTLDGVTIEAPVAIRSEGNAEITVNGGKLTGSTAAAQSAANSQIHLKGTTVVGKLDHKGGSKIDGP